jgi:hypothetical protein
METNNPYAPPNATVADVSSGVAPPRPRAVDAAFWLLWASLLIGIPVAILRVFELAGIEYKIAIIVVVTIYLVVGGLFFWIFGGLRRGRNWARITVLVVTILYVAMQPLVFLQTLAEPPLDATVKILQLVLWVVAAILLFLPRSSAWYRAMKEI